MSTITLLTPEKNPAAHAACNAYQNDRGSGVGTTANVPHVHVSARSPVITGKRASDPSAITASTNSSNVELTTDAPGKLFCTVAKLPRVSLADMGGPALSPRQLYLVIPT
jgi:hypothetical protein